MSLEAQDIKRTAVWYFGQNAGIDFNTIPPTPLTNSAMDTEEGCATICDTSGNLLFYTNGEKIWNKNHQIMENGNGLLGHWSSTQSSLIVPLPKSDSLYYVFTTDAVGQFNGLRYSIVNINANNGLGKVTDAKNILLQTPVCEKLTATHHENGEDIWLISHGWRDNIFNTYLITRKGIVTCPVKSSIGSEHYIFEPTGQPSIATAQGAMKLTPDGKTLAVIVFGGFRVELFDFDKNTGNVLNLKASLNNLSLPYSLEFSPNQQYLYVGADDEKKLYQYDISVPGNLINSTIKVIYSHPSQAITGLQMALDGKVYQAVIQGSFTSRIYRPDSLGDSALFAYNGFNLGGKRSEYGLPNFVTSYFHQPDYDFGYETSCSSNTVIFKPKTSQTLTTQQWKVYNNNIAIDSSTLYSPSFTFSDTGWYAIEWVVNNTDTVKKNVFVDAPILPLKDTLVCNLSSLNIQIPDTYRCLIWQDGSDTNNYVVTTAGKYTIQGYNSRGCLVKDSVEIQFDSISTPNIYQSNDTLFTDSSASAYEWRFNNTIVGANTNSLKVTQNGTYTLKTTNANGCENSNTFEVIGLSVNELKKLPFSIYPNPSNEKFFIEFHNKNTSNRIVIRNLLGQTIYNQTEHNTLVEVALGKAGIYFIEITDAEGKAYATKLIITN